MKKFKLSGFDLGIVIAFVVVALLGGGAWWYFSGALQDAVSDDAAAKSDFDKYSSNPKYHVVVSLSNEKNIEANINLMKQQLIPVIQARLQSKDDKLRTIDKEDPVAWKHDLDDEVRRLNASAKSNNVGVPPNFYFGFSRYLSASPSDVQTAVLTKQLLGIEQITEILIGAKVRDISAIRRTYEEDPHTGSGEPQSSGTDHLGGFSVTSSAGTYTMYPFEVDFDTNSESLRTVLNSLIQSPYIFVVRSLEVKNSNPNSPGPSDLDRMAELPPASVVSSDPGQVAATTSTKGPQWLFGSETLSVKARLDLIEWTADVAAISDANAKGPGQKVPPKKGGP